MMDGFRRCKPHSETSLAGLDVSVVSNCSNCQDDYYHPPEMSCYKRHRYPLVLMQA